jgi:hypothetical protein
VGPHLRKLIATSALVVLGLAAGPAVPTAEASGIITHSWMAASAIPLVSDPALRSILQANATTAESGAHFPDSGYAAGVLGVEDDFGEEAHWPRWHLALADQIAAECPPVPATTSLCARRIALLFGSVAHGMGDEVWDWLFEPNAPDRGESYVPPPLAGQFSTGGLEMQMDLIAIGDYDRRTRPAIPNWPAPGRLAASFDDVDRADVSAQDMQTGYIGISVARNAEANLARDHRDDITRNMRWTSSHVVTAPGGVRFAARAIAAAWANLWGRIQGEQPATEVSVTHPADGETGIPATGWDRTDFQPGSAPDRGGARNRITAVLSSTLPYLPLASTPGGIDEELPTGAMTLTDIGTGDPVALRPGYPRQVPYGAESGEHVIDLQPGTDLAPCTSYRVDVTEVLVDANGDPVTPHSWTFTTDGDACPGPASRPDLSAKRTAIGALVGDDVYTPGGAGQTRQLLTPAGRTATFGLRLENDGSAPDRLRLTGQGSFGTFGVRYFDGRVNVTPRVVAGTYRTPTLAPGRTRNLTVLISVPPRAAAGATVTRLVTVRSVEAPSAVDAVKLTVRRTPAARARAEAAIAAEPALTEAELAEVAPYLQACLLD